MTTNVDGPSKLMRSPEFLATLLEAIPFGVVAIDEDRVIRAANRVFETSLGLEPGSTIGSCEGMALGCINAAENHCHDGTVISQACRTCEARQLAVKAIKMGGVQRGRAHLQVNVHGRVEDVTLALNAAPFNCEDGRFAVVIIENISKLRGLQRPLAGAATLGMIGSDPQMEDLFETIRQVAPLDVPVLIQGESGTGKELVANALHAESRRSDGLLVPVNCGALPDGLLESELFGHVRGSFTGAVKDKRGRFHLADRGTIFLDEIG
jgi:transcriptional regulator with PAS, ATPase and Fis domain